MMHILSLRSHNFYFMCSHRSPSIPSLTYDVATGYVLCRDTMKIRYILSSYPTLPYATLPYPMLPYPMLPHAILSHSILPYLWYLFITNPALPSLVLSYFMILFDESPIIMFLLLFSYSIVSHAALCSPVLSYPFAPPLGR